MRENSLQTAYDSIKNRISVKPDIALILGSGLGDFADHIENKTYIPYHEIAGFPVSTVAGHAGTYVFGSLSGKKIVAMQGRVHYYEGYDMQQVVMPVRIMRMMGADTLILTNAAGGINPEFTPGDLMMITDHITSFVPSALIGPNDEELGTRFPDMSNVYDKGLQEKLRRAAKANAIELKCGVYLQTTGPAYETPAEIRMFGRLGADAVGMSTACEAMAAVHMGMRVAGVSCITNMAAGLSQAPLDHSEVSDTAKRISEQFSSLIRDFIAEI